MHIHVQKPTYKTQPEPLVQRIDAEKAPVNNEFGKVMYEYEDDPIPQYAAGLVRS
jgi:hypothetical protein